MITRIALTVAFGLLLSVGGGVNSQAAAKKRLLVVSHTAGFRHVEGIAAGEKALQEMGEKSGAFTLDYCKNADDVKSMLTVENLKKYDGVVFLNTTGDLGIPDLPAFLNWIRSGKAFIGMHSATDTYHDQPAYIDMIGGEFETHGRQSTVEPIVVDPKHPATSQWPAGFKILEEIYHTKNYDKTKVYPLLVLKNVPDDGTANANQPADFPLAWCKYYGKGRVFYTAFGHRQDVWENEVIRQHMLGGIRWALGLAKGNPKAPK